MWHPQFLPILRLEGLRSCLEVQVSNVETDIKNGRHTKNMLGSMCAWPPVESLKSPPAAYNSPASLFWITWLLHMACELRLLRSEFMGHQIRAKPPVMAKMKLLQEAQPLAGSHSYPPHSGTFLPCCLQARRCQFAEKRPETRKPPKAFCRSELGTDGQLFCCSIM